MRANKIEIFENLMKSYPEYVVDDEKTVRFINRVNNFTPSVTTDCPSDTSCISS